MFWKWDKDSSQKIVILILKWKILHLVLPPLWYFLGFRSPSYEKKFSFVLDNSSKKPMRQMWCKLQDRANGVCSTTLFWKVVLLLCILRDHKFHWHTDRSIFSEQLLTSLLIANKVDCISKPLVNMRKGPVQLNRSYKQIYVCISWIILPIKDGSCFIKDERKYYPNT